MYQLIDFSSWNIYEDAPYGSGASEKIWLEDKNTGRIGLFKFPKIKTNGELTGEHWAEKLAFELGKLLGIQCAEVDIGTYNNRIGSISYNFLNTDEQLREGIVYISSTYPYYNGDRLLETLNNEKYSIQMILNSIKGLGFNEEFFKIPVFDCLIGNSDRHHSNWGTIVNIKSGDKRFAPLYDNGSSLSCYINQEDIDSYFKDGLRFNSMIYTKSLSAIKWKNEKRITHFDLLKYLKEEYGQFIKGYLDMISDTVKENSIMDIVNQFDDSIINEQHKALIVRYIMKRKECMIG